MTPDRKRHLWMATLVGVSLLGAMPAGADHDDRQWKYDRFEKRTQAQRQPYSTQPELRPVAPVPGAQQSGAIAEQAADHALRMIGTPYRYGGNSPSSGFDCSGLVQFSYKRAGATLPRTTEALRHASAPIRSSSLRRGDLVFFDQGWKKNGHVGIYLGAGEFIHAPSSGGRVRRDSLESPYWRKHFSQARRVTA